MDRIWHFAAGGTSKGPFSPQEIQGFLRDGILTADTLVWRKGLSAWTPLHESDLGPELPPPLPDTGPRNRNVSSAMEAQATRVALLPETINPEVIAPVAPRWILRVVRVAAAIAISVIATAYLFVAGAGAFAFRDTVVHQATPAAYVIMGGWLVFGVALLTWMVMLVRAANWLAPGPRQNRPWTVVGWSFVPLANFHKPHEIVQKALTRLRVSHDARTGFRIFWCLLCLGVATQMVGMMLLRHVNWGEVTSLADLALFWVVMAGVVVQVLAVIGLRGVVEMIVPNVAAEEAHAGRWRSLPLTAFLLACSALYWGAFGAVAIDPPPAPGAVAGVPVTQLPDRILFMVVNTSPYSGDIGVYARLDHRVICQGVMRVEAGQTYLNRVLPCNVPPRRLLEVDLWVGFAGQGPDARDAVRHGTRIANR